jgi:hypothetical protein
VAWLSGRYRATYTRQSSSRWTLRPSCDVFGCATKLRSNGGLIGTLRPQSNGTYELERRTKIGECRIASDDGSRKTWGIYKSFSTIPPRSSALPATPLPEAAAGQTSAQRNSASPWPGSLKSVRTLTQPRTVD